MQEKSFEKVLNTHKKMKVTLYLHDAQFIEGILLDVKKDYVVIDTGEDVLYFAISHIRALSKNAKYLQVQNSRTPYLVRDDLEDILIALRYNWVTINGSSKYTLFGVLRSIMKDHIMLVNNAELLYIPKEHIATIHSNLSVRDINFINNQRQRSLQNLYKLRLGKRLLDMEGRFVSIKRHTDIQKYRINQKEQKVEEIPDLPHSDLEAIELVTTLSMEDINGVSAETSEPLQSDFQDAVNEVDFNIEFQTHHEEMAEITEVNTESMEENQLLDESISGELIAPNYIQLLKDEIKHTQQALLEPQPEELEIESPVLGLTLTVINEEKHAQSQETTSAQVSLESIEEYTLDSNYIVEAVNELVELINLTEDQLNAPAELENQDNTLLEQEEIQQETAIEEISEDVQGENTSVTLAEADETIHYQDELEQEQSSKQHHAKQNEKRILLTAWSAINPDQSIIPLTKKSSKKIELLPLESKVIEAEPSIDIENELQELTVENELETNIAEIPVPTENLEVSVPQKNLNPTEVKEMLEKQYYALMNFAASASLQGGFRSKTDTNANVYLPHERSDQRALTKAHPSIGCKMEKEVLEKQFDSLMKHAAKMYRQLRDYQLDMIE